MTVSTSKEPARIAGMFDDIAWRYDRLNHLLSAGIDRRWRRRAVRELKLTGRERVLDMCTGTADLAIEAATSPFGAAQSVVGIDFSSEMLRHAQPKLRAQGLDRRIWLARGDATRMPLPDASFDAATVAFGIRNVQDPARACREFFRVLRPGARLAVLEFGKPTAPVLGATYQWYFRNVLPRVGRLLSRHSEAYEYLPASVAEFPPPELFADQLKAAGFRVVRHEPLTLGVVRLYVAER